MVFEYPRGAPSRVKKEDWVVIGCFEVSEDVGDAPCCAGIVNVPGKEGYGGLTEVLCSRRKWGASPFSFRHKGAAAQAPPNPK